MKGRGFIPYYLLPTTYYYMDGFNLDKYSEVIGQLREDFDAIAMPRPAYVLEHLVVRPNEHVTQQWQQCVLELRVKYNNIRRSLLQRQKLLREIESEQDDLEAQIKQIDLDDLDWGLLGMAREFEALHAIYQQFPKRFTREELDAGQAEYWYNRLTKQAIQDIMATGRVGVGNQDALRQIHAEVRVNKEGQIEIVQHSHIALNGSES